MVGWGILLWMTCRCASVPFEPRYPSVGCRVLYAARGATQQKVLVIGSYSDSQFKVLLPGDKIEQWKPIDKSQIRFAGCWDTSMWGFNAAASQEPPKIPENR